MARGCDATDAALTPTLGPTVLANFEVHTEGLAEEFQG